jgi:hypothetical protein
MNAFPPLTGTFLEAVFDRHVLPMEITFGKTDDIKPVL